MIRVCALAFVRLKVSNDDFSFFSMLTGLFYFFEVTDFIFGKASYNKPSGGMNTSHRKSWVEEALKVDD